MTTCHYHRDRAGVGVCMRCRMVICAACCTRLDGVNHCHACLKVLAQRQEPKVSRDLASSVGALGIVAAGCLLVFGLAWLVQGRLAP